MKNLKVNLFYIFLILLPIISYSQNFDNNGKPLVNFSTPRNTLFVFIQYLSNEFYDPKTAAKTLNSDSKNIDSLANLSIKLKKIIDGKGLIINITNISIDSNYIDSTTGLNRFVLFSQIPDIYLEKTDNKWLFSKYTLSQINKIYNQMYPYNINDFVNDLPAFFQFEILWVKLWQWIGIILLIALSILSYLIFDKIIIYILKKIINKIFPIEKLDLVLPKIAHPIGLLIILLLFKKFLPVLSLKISILYYINLVLNLSIPVIITYTIYRFVDYISLYFVKFAERTENKLDDKIIPLIRKFIKIIVVIFGGLYIIKNTGLDITPLLAGVSIGSLAIALAAQETLRNLFGSISLFADKVFEVGDWIIAEDIDGTVEEIGIRSTKIRTFNDSVIFVPNGKLADMKINNMGKRRYRRFRTNISITYDTPPEKINQFTDGIKLIIANHPQTRKDYIRVFLNNLGDSAILILFDIFFEVDNIETELKARHEIINEIIKFAEKINVSFAFPTQTIHLINEMNQKL